jgi:hypothetical protein
MNKSRKRRAEHVACTGNIRNAYKIVIILSKEKGHLGDLSIDETVILKLMLQGIIHETVG